MTQHVRERTRAAGVAKCGVLEDLRLTALHGCTTNGREIVENGQKRNVLNAHENDKM